MSGLLTADQLDTLEAGANGTAHLLSGDASPDSIWVICHALAESATRGRSVGHLMQVCRAWRDYVLSVKDELYAAILPRAFPRTKCISMVLGRGSPSRVSREVLYRRHLEAQLALTPLESVNIVVRQTLSWPSPIRCTFAEHEGHGRDPSWPSQIRCTTGVRDRHWQDPTWPSPIRCKSVVLDSNWWDPGWLL